MFYIYEDDKPRNIKKFFMSKFNFITVEENKIKLPQLNKIRIISKSNGKKLVKRKDYTKKERQLNKITKKVVCFLNKTNTKKIVLSKKLLKEHKFINNLNQKGFEVADGKFLFKVLASRILDYIINKEQIIDDKENEKIEKFKIAILANNLDYVVEENIKLICEKYKNVSIVTKHPNKFKPLLTNLYDNEGIVLVLTNNKKKSLNKANVILNFDFNEEMLNKYMIYENAYVVNFNGKTQIYKKRFNGINIHDYEITINKNLLEELISFNLVDKFFIKDIFEALLYKNQPISDIFTNIINANVHINYLITNKTKF